MEKKYPKVIEKIEHRIISKLLALSANFALSGFRRKELNWLLSDKRLLTQTMFLLEKSELQHPAFWHARIMKRGVPAKIFLGLFCYFWFLTNQNSENIDTKKQKKSAIIYIYDWHSKDCLIYFIDRFFKNLVLSKLHSACSEEHFEEKNRKKIIIFWTLSKKFSVGLSNCILCVQRNIVDEIFFEKCSHSHVIGNRTERKSLYW